MTARHVSTAQATQAEEAFTHGWRFVHACPEEDCPVVIVGKVVDVFVRELHEHEAAHVRGDVGERAASPPTADDDDPDVGDGNLVMSFPVPITWWTMKQAIGAIYDSSPPGAAVEYSGLDVVHGTLALHPTDGSAIEVRWHPGTTAPDIP